MQYATVDSIVRRTLLEKGYPIHWYAEFLFHATACIREIFKDTMKVVNTVNLPLNDYNAADLPADFVDEVAVAIPVGSVLHPVSKSDSINPIRLNNTTTGAFTSYEDIDNDSPNTFFLGSPNFQWFWNFSDWGEPTGRFFGANGAAHQNGYKVVRERRQIQFTEIFTGDNVILSYISNGQNLDNASQIDYRAWSTIQAYINWKRSRNADANRSPEAMTFYNERRLLRAQMNDMTLTDLKNILRKNYFATIKN